MKYDIPKGTFCQRAKDDDKTRYEPHTTTRPVTLTDEHHRWEDLDFICFAVSGFCYLIENRLVKRRP